MNVSGRIMLGCRLLCAVGGGSVVLGSSREGLSMMGSRLFLSLSSASWFVVPISEMAVILAKRLTDAMVLRCFRADGEDQRPVGER